MSELNPKALEAAGIQLHMAVGKIEQIFAQRDPPPPAEWTAMYERKVKPILEAYNAEAGLVERSELDKLVPSWALIKLGEAQNKYLKLRDAKFKQAANIMALIIKERDEARREAEGLRSDLAYSKNEFELQTELIEELSKQLAALGDGDE